MAEPHRINPTDIAIYREDFPALTQPMNGQALAYLDTASSAQKPSFVLERMRDIAQFHYANIHRGLYRLSHTITQEYEAVRTKVAEFINASSEKEVIFTRNSTEGINLVAQSWGRTFLQAGDEIILTQMEHHANIVPWQILEKQIGIVIKVLPVLDDGTLDLSALPKLLNEKTRLVSFVHISNSIGTVNPAQHIIRTVKSFNPAIKVLVDASQSIVHGGVDVRALGCDFLVFTGHKLYGPTGVGVLWGRYDILESMPPYQGGGDMIEKVSFAGTTFKPPPARFEAGTPAIIEVIGLGAAIDYIHGIGQERIVSHEKTIGDYLTQSLANLNGVTIYGRAQEKAGIVSFTAQGIHASDIAMVLDQCGVAVRTGHHCCMPLMERFGIEGTVRASIGLYTNKADIDALINGLKKAHTLLG